MVTSGVGSVLSVNGLVVVGDLAVIDKLGCFGAWVFGGDVLMFRGLLTCEGLVAGEILDEGGGVVGAGSLVGVFGSKQTCSMRLVLLIIFPQLVHGVDLIVSG